MKKVIFERLSIAIIIVLCAFSSWIFISRAGLFDGMGEEGPGDNGDVGKGESGIYYFNNAIDTSPNEIGNYWYDSGLSDQALELPDFSSAQVSVATDSTFDGDIIFNSEAINNGTINGNATFINDLSENIGTITGNAVRRYTSVQTTSRDFTGKDIWTVIADGVVLDITSASYDESTVFSHENSGSFISNMAVVSETINDKDVTLQFDRTLNSDSVPAVEDFIVMVDDEKAEISNISISENRVILRLANSVTSKSTVTISYTLGSNLILSTQGLNALPLEGIAVTNETPPMEEVVENSPELQDNIAVRSGSSFLFPSRLLSVDDKSLVLEEQKKKEAEEAKESTEATDKLSSADEKAISSPESSAPIVEEIQRHDKVAASSEIVEKLKTPLLLAVEDKGKIWYVAPTSGERYEVSQSNALNLFRSVALGITNKDLSQIPLANSDAKSTKIGARLEGRFLLQVESRGESWFVQGGYRYRVNGDNLVEVTKKSVGGIKNQILEKIPVATK
jgi:uncharacterized repeat protein (TIGR02059 family)